MESLFDSAGAANQIYIENSETENEINQKRYKTKDNYQEYSDDDDESENENDPIEANNNNKTPLKSDDSNEDNKNTKKQAYLQNYNQVYNLKSFSNYPQNPELINAILQSEQLMRTCSNASSTSSSSTCSSNMSTCSSNDLFEPAVNENHLKALMLTAAANAQKPEDPQSKPALIAAFADQFAYMIRTRSSSVSESSSTSSSSSTNGDLMKQMINSYQSSMIKPTCSSPTPSSPTSAKKPISTQIKQTEAKPNELTGSNNACKVCGDEASGFHYGVDSCEGCKGFFRRCITQGMNHQCTNNQQCEMTPFSRNSCQFCRLKKCFAVGMSREASRLGRRPKRAKDDSTSEACSTANYSLTPLKNSYEEKNKDLTPASPSVTVLQTQQGSNLSEDKYQKLKKEKEKPVVQNFLSLNQAPFKLETYSPEKSPQMCNEKSSTESKNQLQIQQAKVALNGNSVANSTNNILQSRLKGPTSAAQLQKEISQQQIQHFEMLTKLISITDKYTSIERTNELEFIRSTIIESHLKTWPLTMEKIRKRYLDRPPSRISAQNLAESNMTSLANEIIQLVKDVVLFCKYIPGFNQILQHDQLQLLQQGSFEVICVNSLILVDSQNKLMLTVDLEYLLDQNSIKQIPFGPFLSEVFELALQVSSMKLHDSEISIFNALLIMNPDRGDLQDKDHIEELQATLLHVLYKHLKYYRNDGCELFFKLLKLIPNIQEINRKYSEVLMNQNLPESSFPEPISPVNPTNNSNSPEQ